jgi:hypothetical protein
MEIHLSVSVPRWDDVDVKALVVESFISNDPESVVEFYS